MSTERAKEPTPDKARTGRQSPDRYLCCVEMSARPFLSAPVAVATAGDLADLIRNAHRSLGTKFLGVSITDRADRSKKLARVTAAGIVLSHRSHPESAVRPPGALLAGPGALRTLRLARESGASEAELWRRYEENDLGSIAAEWLAAVEERDGHAARLLAELAEGISRAAPVRVSVLPVHVECLEVAALRALAKARGPGDLAAIVDGVYSANERSPA